MSVRRVVANCGVDNVEGYASFKSCVVATCFDPHMSRDLVRDRAMVDKVTEMLVTVQGQRRGGPARQTALRES